MKICILSTRFPWPERGGDYIRTNRVARYLKSQGHEVVLVCFNEGQADIDAIKQNYDKIYTIKRSRLATLYHSLTFALRRKPIQCGYYYSLAYKRLLKKVIAQEKPDRYVCWLLRMTPYAEELHLEDKTILEMSDALSKTYTLSSRAKGSRLKRFVYNLERKPIFDCEKQAILHYPKVVLVAQPDIDYLRSLVTVPVRSLTLHSIGIEGSKQVVEHYDAAKLCFIGNMRTLQNQDAVFHFVNHIFPLILEQKPEAKFYIVGAEPSQDILKLGQQKNIVVTGFVDDIRAAIADSCLAVAPVQVAAGIQNKVLMAMGTGLPVVMSSLISKAIPQLVEGENCFVRDDNKAFADACVRLMNDRSLRMQMAKNGFEMTRNHYSWEAQLKGYECLPDN